MSNVRRRFTRHGKSTEERAEEERERKEIAARISDQRAQARSKGEAPRQLIRQPYGAGQWGESILRDVAEAMRVSQEAAALLRPPFIAGIAAEQIIVDDPLRWSTMWQEISDLLEMMIKLTGRHMKIDSLSAEAVQVAQRCRACHADIVATVAVNTPDWRSSIGFVINRTHLLHTCPPLEPTFNMLSGPSLQELYELTEVEMNRCATRADALKVELDRRNA